MYPLTPLKVFMLDRVQDDRRCVARMERILGALGIASGEVIAGYTGTLRRATYTCVGDTVNLAARLEAHTKVVGEPILIDESTRNSLSNAILVKDEGMFTIKGKTDDVHVYSVPVGQNV